MEGSDAGLMQLGAGMELCEKDRPVSNSDAGRLGNGGMMYAMCAQKVSGFTQGMMTTPEWRKLDVWSLDAKHKADKQTPPSTCSAQKAAAVAVAGSFEDDQGRWMECGTQEVGGEKRAAHRSLLADGSLVL